MSQDVLLLIDDIKVASEHLLIKMDDFVPTNFIIGSHAQGSRTFDPGSHSVKHESKATGLGESGVTCSLRDRWSLVYIKSYGWLETTFLWHQWIIPFWTKVELAKELCYEECEGKPQLTRNAQLVKPPPPISPRRSLAGRAGLHPWNAGPTITSRVTSGQWLHFSVCWLSRHYNGIGSCCED